MGEPPRGRSRASSSGPDPRASRVRPFAAIRRTGVRHQFRREGQRVSLPPKFVAPKVAVTQAIDIGTLVELFVDLHRAGRFVDLHDGDLASTMST